LPVGNGRIGAMVFGGVEQELLQLNEQTVWSGNRSDYDRVGAFKHLPEIRRLLFAGKHAEADALVKKEILGERPLGSYQPLGDLTLNFSGGGEVADYRRELDMGRAVAKVSYRQGDAVFSREVFVSAPANVLVVRLSCDKPGRVSLAAAPGPHFGRPSRSGGQ
jgi:alpha-L-fucosidase 2